MNKKRWFLIIIFFLLQTKLYADEFCSKSKINAKLENLKKISIELKNNKKWIINYFNIVLSSEDYIKNKFKNKFNSRVHFYFKDGSECFDVALIRVSGDLKDHVSDHVSKKKLITSLDVELKNHHIGNITKFKLFMPGTKNEYNSILFSSILEDLGFLKRREKILEVEFMGSTQKYYFHEKITKEFLENNKLREGPIIVVNENNIWTDKKKYLDRYLLKIIDENWLYKNDINLEMGIQILNIFDHMYLDFHNSRNINRIRGGDPWYKEKNLNLNILKLYNYNFNQVQLYELSLVIFDAFHGLWPNNRKYYVDTFANKIYPISYDELPEFSIIQNKIQNLNYDISFEKNFLKSFLNKIENINLLNVKKLYKEKSGEEIEEIYLKKVIDNSKENLSYLIKNFYEQKYEKINISNYFEKLDNFDILKILTSKNEFFSCKNDINSCEKIELSRSQKSKIISGKPFKINNIKLSKYLYVGDMDLYFNNQFSVEKNKYKIAKYKDIEIFYEDGIEIMLDKKKNLININQLENNKKIIFYNGQLKGTHIVFNGNYDQISKKPIALNDLSNLTGCVNFIDTFLDDINIVSNNSTCEDGINIVRSKGTIQSIESENSISDSIDLDFSEIKFNKIIIKNSKNDCIDFSYGIYEIEYIETSNCGDKSVSVGENSILKINNLNDSFSNISLASKDSSITYVKTIKSEKSNICMTAYRKKQEFDGGKIFFNSSNCENFKIDSLSDIKKIKNVF